MKYNHYLYFDIFYNTFFNAYFESFVFFHNFIFTFVLRNFLKFCYFKITIWESLDTFISHVICYF